MIKKAKEISYIFEEKDLYKFKEKMAKKGYKTFTEIAEKLDVSKAYICAVVNGKKPVKKAFFEKLKTLGINMGVKL